MIDGAGSTAARRVMLHAYDCSGMGAYSAKTAGWKAQHSRRNAEKNGVPLVLLNECSGARIPDIMGAAGIHETSLYFDLYRTRTTPWASAVLGACYGGGTRHSRMSGFVVMPQGAAMAVSRHN